MLYFLASCDIDQQDTYPIGQIFTEKICLQAFYLKLGCFVAALIAMTLAPPESAR
jgi:hypothetical protein